MTKIEQRRVLAIFFVCVVVYGIFAMTISREFIIPYMIASTDGHISGDPQYYHQLALTKVKDIQDGGFHAFELRPAGQGPAGVASLLYLIWENPYGVVLVNAILHGISAVVMALILLQWFPLRTSLLATLPLVISPYMMVWFSQLNKDTYALAGALLFVYGVLRLIKIQSEQHTKLHAALIALSGVLLVWIVRPYLNQILFPISAVIFTFILWLLLKRIGWFKKDVAAFSIYGAAILISLGLMGKGAASDETIDSFRKFEVQTHSEIQTQSQSVADKCFVSVDVRNWENSFVPSFVSDKLRGLMGQRCLMFTLLKTTINDTTQNSFVDLSTFPAGSLEALAYLPRAALLGVFAPWPNRWGYVFNNQFSVFYTITPLEAVMLYGGIFALILWLLRSRAWSVLTPVFLCISVMTVYGMATPFIGALYRYRYPWWMLLISIGLAASLELTLRYQGKKKRSQHSTGDLS